MMVLTCNNYCISKVECCLKLVLALLGTKVVIYRFHSVKTTMQH